jgi:hypothetical protein
VACDRAKLDEATVSPDDFVRRRLANRAGPEPAGPLGPADRIAHFEGLIRARLSDLARPVYTLRFGGTAYDPRVTIEARRRPSLRWRGPTQCSLPCS